MNNDGCNTMSDGSKNNDQWIQNQRMMSACAFLNHYERQGDKFFLHIVTGDETWISYVYVESKLQSMQYDNSNS